MPIISLKANNKRDNLLTYLAYGTTIFLSAFLLFLVQPLISKYILPWFGGTASVWTIVVLFFETTLLIGYLYAHLISRYLSLSKQAILHLILLFIIIALLPILPKASWAPQADDNPIIQILILLSVAVGLPAIILSATSPLLQNWLTKIRTKDSPYKLYALSNAGSLIALLGFPFFFEPHFPIQMQSKLWSILFIIYVILFIFCSLWFLKFRRLQTSLSNQQQSAEKNNKPLFKTIILWLALSTCTSVLLLAVTNKISQDIPVVPFLWVVPLSLYLISFIIVFSSDFISSWISKNIFSLVLLALIMIFGSLDQNLKADKIWQISTYLILLFLFSLVCHNELAKIKPATPYLTFFYLLIACGGVLGGIFVGLLAPIFFNSYLELPIILIICSLITLWFFLKDREDWQKIFDMPIFKKRKAVFIMLILAVVYLYVFGTAVFYIYKMVAKPNLASARNFYGVLHVKTAYESELNDYLTFLWSGDIIHGSQFKSLERSKIPTTYYGTESGLGLIFKAIPPDKKLRIGAIGLGAGTLATYGKAGDYIKFYEINPEVERLNRQFFSYLKDSLAQIEIKYGDARLSLAQEPEQNFDIMVIDAFTGDSIPIHLLTKEAFEIYLKNLKPDGILAVHISNKYLKLEPVLLKLSEYFKIPNVIIKAKGNIKNDTCDNRWVLLSSNSQLLQSPIIINNKSIDVVKADNFKLWTDDFSNLFSVLRN